jgi:hypothetical protein
VNINGASRQQFAMAHAELSVSQTVFLWVIGIIGH